MPEHDHLNLAASGEPQRLETVWSAFVDAARARPDAVAVVGERGDLTYGQLKAHADAVADQLAAHGVHQGDRVALLCQRDALVPAAMLGIASLGAVFVPIETDAPLARRSQVLQLAGCRAVISNLPSEERPEGALDLRAISMPTSEARSAPNRQIGPNDPVSVMFTSGSTGQPKGVLIPHRAIVRLARARILDLGPGCRFLHASSLAFDASTLEIWGPLLNGGTVVTMEGKPDLKLLERAFREQGVTAAWLTAALFHLCADTNPAMFAPLTTLLTGGDVVSPKHAAATLAANPHLRLVNGYGPTENTTFTTTYDIRDPDPATPLPIGRPIAGTGVVIVDEHLRPVPPGEVGELIATGEGLALGYLNNPELTRARFITISHSAEPGYRTGDLARVNQHGEIEFKGRNDDQVKVNGFRVEPGEIEGAIRRIPGVRDATVIAWSGSEGFALHAFVITDDPNVWYSLQSQIRIGLGEALPVYLRPSSISQEETLPRTSSGKVDRAALRQILECGVTIECDPNTPGPISATKLLAVAALLARRWHPHDDDAEFFVMGSQTRHPAAGWDEQINRINRVDAFAAADVAVSLPLAGGGHAVLEARGRITARFPHATSQRARRWLAHHVARATSAVLADSPNRVGELDILSAEEREYVTTTWNQTDQPIETDRSLIDLILDRCETHPDRIALRSDQDSMTYGELGAEIRSIAASIALARPNDRGPVAVFDERSVPTIVCVLGILASGRACVPLNRAMPSERVRVMLDISKAKLLVSAGDDSGLADAPESLSYSHIRAESGLEGRVGIDPTSTAFVLFTSGSAGTPKGVPIRHQSLANRVLWQMQDQSFTEDDVIAQKNQLSWDVSMWEYLLPLVIGAQCAVLDSPTASDPKRLLNAARCLGITAWHLLPSMLIPVAQSMESDTPPIRVTVCSGEALAPSAAAEWLSCLPGVLNNLYGPTEAAIEVTQWRCEAHNDAVPIGRPIANTRISVVDPGGRACPVGVPGEIVLHGVQVSEGYLNNPEKTAESFIPCAHFSGRKAYRTGDLGWWRDDGAVCFRGRIDAQMKIFGFRVEPGEIEAALVQSGLVSDAAACVVLAGTERVIAALCTPRTGIDRPTDSSVFAALRRGLESHAVPSRIVWTDRIPKLSNGKIDRRAVSTIAQNATQKLPEAVTSTDALDISGRVRQVWIRLLGLPPASDAADFVSSGGNSLLLLRMFFLLEQATGVQLARLPSLQSQTPASIAGAFQTASNPIGAEARYGTGAEIRANCAGHLRKLTDGPGVILAIPHLGGTLGYLANAASALDGAAELYGILQAGLLPGESPLESVHDMIAGYADLVQAQGWMRLRLIGYSSGATIAVDLAHQLTERGVEVTRLFLVDGIPCHRPALHPRLRKTYSKFMWRVPKSLTPLRAPNTRPYDLSGYQHEQFALAHATIRALFRHTPARYRGRTTIVRTAKSVELAQADSWKRVITGPMDEVVLAGANHSNVWDPPHVDGIVDALRQDE
ncbi:amino acid adenylation domain-containing protein [Nodularia spumigena]|uniref:amino acid adenylation domain-containing protein n=1 Tax=Nodularia spumigena TaxID=70799 RepID=UPI002B1FB8D2|nr:amino acid adenylation domain-containing protein [Nodularia spumigena]MEA5612396.1 amino acid adenylation domain-containing protein [Nodularia spumigena UHCC 0040]